MQMLKARQNLSVVPASSAWTTLTGFIHYYMGNTVGFWTTLQFGTNMPHDIDDKYLAVFYSCLKALVA